MKYSEMAIESAAGRSCTQFCANRFPTGLQPTDSQFSLRKSGQAFLSINIRCKDEWFHFLFNHIFEIESKSSISTCMNIWNWHFVSEPEEMKWNFSATLHFLWTLRWGFKKWDWLENNAYMWNRQNWPKFCQVLIDQKGFASTLPGIILRFAQNLKEKCNVSFCRVHFSPQTYWTLIWSPAFRLTNCKLPQLNRNKIWTQTCKQDRSNNLTNLFKQEPTDY